jgi:hypothetical protein
LICGPCAREEKRKEIMKAVERKEIATASTIMEGVQDLYNSWVLYGEDDERTRDLFLELMANWDRLLE